MSESGKLTSRTALTCSLAVICTPQVAASPVASDPIFTAIEAHRRVYAEILALLNAQTAANRAVQQADAVTRPALEARLDELCRAEGPLGRLEIRASTRMAATLPTTLEGAVAVLRYLRELFARDQYAPFEEEDYRTLLFSTERAIAQHLRSPDGA